MATIHPTAIIEEGAAIAETAEIGAYAYVGGEARIGPECRIHHHATVEGRTEMGRRNEIFPYALIGGRTHDLKHRGGRPGLRIGDHNVFREYTTVHLATKDDEYTVIGNHNTILAYSHIAHDCRIADSLIMSSHAALGGHVVCGDHANIGWGTGVHQFCRVGTLAMVGAASKLVQDAPPYLISDGNPAGVRAPNRVGLERAGYDPEANAAVQRAFRLLYREGLNRTQALEKLEETAGTKLVAELIAFYRGSQRGVC